MFRNSTRPVRRFLRDRRAAATAYVAIGVVIMTVGGAAVIVDHDRLVDRRDLLKSAADAVSMSATLELSGLPSSMSDGDVEERLPVIHALHTAIARRFRQEDIEIAFPQMDIHVKTTSPRIRDGSAPPFRLAGTS